MVWGAFCSRGTLPVSFTSSKMESDDFISVLDTNLFPFIRRFRPKKYTFQLDNASIHTSSATSRWFSEKHIEVLEGPSCSPDFNPMQNLWGILARGIYANNKQFQSKDELKTAILNA